MSEKFGSISYADIMDEIFARSKSFSGKEYYEEMIRICPELKKKWWERIPSEEQIKKMVADWYAEGVVDGKESIPEAEEKLGIAIGGGYKFPNGMSDVEYNREHTIKDGCFNPFQEDNGRDFCFDSSITKDGQIFVNPKPDKTRAYIQAWRNLQYGDREQILSGLQKDWAELCDLNPELKSIKFDKNNMASLVMAQAGVIYDFPAKDIELFLQENEKGVELIARTHEARIQRELAEAGIKDFTPHWVPSSETIKMMGERLREKEAREKGFAMQNVAAKEAAEDAMDKVEQKLAVKGSAKAAAMTAEQVAEKAAKKSGILAQAATANAKFDKAVDNAVEQGAQALNNTKVGKAYEKAAQVVSETAAAKTVSKTVEKATQKAAQTTVGKAVTKTVAKTAGSAVGKSVLKKIPLVSLGAGAWFAWDRIKDGDWKGACGELASGALGCLPGLGTAASTAIDVGLAAKDISEVVAENKQNQSSEVAETKIAKVGRAPKNLSKQIEERLNAEKTEQNDSTSVQKLTPSQISFFKKQKQNSA